MLTETTFQIYKVKLGYKVGLTHSSGVVVGIQQITRKNFIRQRLHFNGDIQIKLYTRQLVANAVRTSDSMQPSRLLTEKWLLSIL